jgi:hypothetical protein
MDINIQGENAMRVAGNIRARPNHTPLDTTCLSFIYLTD